MRRLLRLLVRLFVIGLVLGVLALAGAAYWAHDRLTTPYAAHDGSAELAVEPGTGAASILRRLEASGVLQDAWLARLHLIYRLGDPPLMAGEYRFEGALTVDQALGKLIRGEVMTHPVTVIEGLTLEETADTLAAAGFGARDALLAEMRDPGRIIDLDPDAVTLEGYLFPDTYSFARSTTAAQVVDAMVDTFRRRFDLGKKGPSLSPAPELDKAAGKTKRPANELRALVTLASIIEKEAQLDDERAIISGVYSNRLRRGIALYADPTVIFAKRLAGTWDGNLTKADLQMDSPYNTYKNPGLPPGPICSPGLASLEAARSPAEVPYLYFVSRNDGSHVFATTLAEHNRNVNEWQRRYWRKRWAAERGKK